jgi:phosphoribosyl-AMP cyclohydrolase
MTINSAGLNRIQWNEQGLVAAIAQDATSGEVLMMAWMNREALTATLVEGRAVYWSRSRGALWRKGESSGHTQILRELRLDCDSDTLLLKVEQIGGIACHTGRRHCFMHRFEDGEWAVCEPVEKDPAEIY